MDVILSVSNIIFVILAVLLVILILLQSDKSAGMGILGGSSQTTFGSSTADVITKITTVMVALFMLGSLALAVLESYKERAIEKDFDSDTTEIVDEKAAESSKSDENKTETQKKDEK